MSTEISASTSFGQVFRKHKAMPGLSAFVSDATKRNAPGFDHSAFERGARYRVSGSIGLLGAIRRGLPEPVQVVSGANKKNRSVLEALHEKPASERG
jgi:hypothetical protein